MRCVFPNCNLDSNCDTEGITFHPIPVRLGSRTTWLKILNLESADVTEDSAVCSKHFLKQDMYISSIGTWKVRQGARPVIDVQNVPISFVSDVKICRICFATDCKLYKMTEYNNLDHAYETLTGLSLENEDNLPQYLCPECARRLLNCVQFRDRSLRAHLVLLEVVRKHDDITLQSIISVIGNDGPFGSHLNSSQTYNYEIKHVKSGKDNIEQGADVTDNTVQVKIEKDDAVDGDTDGDGTATDTVGYLPDLHEHYDIKNDNDDYNNQEEVRNEEDIPNDIECLTVNENINVKDSGQVEEINTDVSEGGMNKDIVVSMVKCDDEKNFLVMVKKTDRDLIKLVKKAPAKGKSRQQYLPCPSYRVLADKLIIKPGSHAKPKPTPEGFSQTNIVKLRKRIADKSNAEKKIHDKYTYKTISDVPLWDRLKTTTAIKPFNCRMCDFKTGYKKELLVHEKTHCVKAHAHELMLNHAEWAGHSGDKMVACDVCNQVFVNKSHLYRHIEITSGGKPYSCDICKTQFKSSSELDVHNRKHNMEKKPYKCNLCDKSFNFETSLSLHIRRLHQGKSVKKMYQDFRVKKEF